MLVTKTRIAYKRDSIKCNSAGIQNLASFDKHPQFAVLLYAEVCTGCWVNTVMGMLQLCPGDV